MGSAYVIGQAAVCLQYMEQELLLFTAFWLLLGACDDLATDIVWLRLQLAGKGRSTRLSQEACDAPLIGRAAIFIACWREEAVIGHTLRHAIEAWPVQDFRLYVGCYANDPATLAAAMEGAGQDPRIRLVIHSRHGPTTKADCLNRLYAALCEDERRWGQRFRSVILHDSEDMVHPAELTVIDTALKGADFVQIPVRPEPQPRSRWIGGHYLDEFAEAHSKSLVIRDALGAALPAAGVGCGFSREMLARIAGHRQAEGNNGPFAAECLTEDYELGVLVWRAGGKSRFIRARDARGDLVATRAYFPSRLEDSIRQKTRWIHGIAFQSWDRLGWSPLDGGAGLADVWMSVRDRRGPLTAIILAASYLLVMVEVSLAALRIAGWHATPEFSPTLRVMLVACGVSLAWRCALRVLFTAREYGPLEGLYALLRLPVANLISIFAGKRALVSYLRTLAGGSVVWDKTHHDAHPAAMATVSAPRAAVPVKATQGACENMPNAMRTAA
ncbi:glycosyl transferase family protein [Novosphingobium sp. PhB165]|uniref:glycosyl transferase family protein n=1 Tax=Novosphingobium sp. PhB165 TaxID=2485105 RepID=UPI0024370CD6|nr:glycosyl transferase family protein [Novosphingobium sp. PhB165]